MTRINRFPQAFANAAASKPATPPAPPPAPPVAPVAPVAGAAPAAPAKPVVPAPVLTAATFGVAIPANVRKVGKASKYTFDALLPPDADGKLHSFGIANRTAKNMTSVLSSQNKKYLEPKRGEDGKVIMKMIELRDANGVVVETKPGTEPAEMIETRKFVCYDVDPTTDPDKATCRVWRTK